MNTARSGSTSTSLVRKQVAAKRFVHNRSVQDRVVRNGMYTEGNLLRESRQLSNARNKYTTGMIENSSLAKQFVDSRKSQENYIAKEKKIGECIFCLDLLGSITQYLWITKFLNQFCACIAVRQSSPEI